MRAFRIQARIATTVARVLRAAAIANRRFHATDEAEEATGIPAEVGSAMLSGWTSASAKAAGEGKRSAGSFCSAFRTEASTCGGIVFRWIVSERGSSVITRATIAWTVGPVNGGSPTSISYRTQPRA